MIEVRECDAYGRPTIIPGISYRLLVLSNFPCSKATFSKILELHILCGFKVRAVDLRNLIQIVCMLQYKIIISPPQTIIIMKHSALD